MAFTMKRNTFKDEQLRVHVEEISAWLPHVLDGSARQQGGKLQQRAEGADDAAPQQDDEDDVDVDEFFERLSDGVDLCRLIERVSPASSWSDGADAPEPDVKCPHNPNAKPGSFQARDNVAKFLEACKKLGLRDVTLFTTEDLMARKNDARVVGVLLDLARVGAENGVEAPQIVQYERELDEAGESDSDDEEVERFVPEQYGLTQAELDAVQRVFDGTTADDAAVASQAGLVRALEGDDEVQRLRGEREPFDRKLRNAAAAATDAACALDEFLNWLKKQEKNDPPAAAGADAGAAGEAAEPAVPKAAGMSMVRPRGFSLSQRKYTFLHLPYVPVPGDQIDEALAEIANANQLDIRIRRIAVRRKKGKDLEGAYRIGSGSQPKVFLRIVRGLLMVRVGNKWESVVRYAQRKMAEEYA